MGNSLTESDYKCLFLRVPTSYTSDYGILSYNGLLAIEKLYKAGKIPLEGDARGFGYNYAVLKERLSVVDADYRRYVFCLNNPSVICLEDCKKYHQFFFADMCEDFIDFRFVETYYLEKCKQLVNVKVVNAGDYVIGKADLLKKDSWFVNDKSRLVYLISKEYKFDTEWFCLNKITNEIFELTELS